MGWVPNTWSTEGIQSISLSSLYKKQIHVVMHLEIWVTETQKRNARSLCFKFSLSLSRTRNNWFFPSIFLSLQRFLAPSFDPQKLRWSTAGPSNWKKAKNKRKEENPVWNCTSLSSCCICSLQKGCLSLFFNSNSLFSSSSTSVHVKRAWLIKWHSSGCSPFGPGSSWTV